MGKYEILKVLGKGVDGIVFKSTIRHRGENIDVAVKRFDILGKAKAKIAQDELDILKNLTEHANVIKFFESSQDEDFMYLVTELGELGDLANYLISKVPEMSEKLKIMENTASGLYFLHSSSPPIIHRDIKLQNVILKKEGSEIVAKLCDFGLSTFYQLDSDKVLNMFTEVGKGTCGYMAPELLEDGRKQYDETVDVFALGLLFMVLLNRTQMHTSLKPYPGKITM